MKIKNILEQTHLRVLRTLTGIETLKEVIDYLFEELEHFYPGKLYMFALNNEEYIEIIRIKGFDKKVQKASVLYEGRQLKTAQLSKQIRTCLNEKKFIDFTWENIEEQDAFIKNRFKWWNLKHMFCFPISQAEQATLGFLAVADPDLFEFALQEKVQSLLEIFYPCFQRVIQSHKVKKAQKSLHISRDRYRTFLAIPQKINLLENLYRIS